MSDINAQFHDLVRWGEYEKVVAVLREKRAGSHPTLDLNGKDKHGRTALMVASKHGHKKLVLALLKEGVEIDQHDPSGNTAVIYSAIGGHTEVAKLLIKAGANVAKTNKFGRRTHDLAIKAGFSDLAQIFEDAGAFAEAEKTYDEKTHWKNTLSTEVEEAEHQFHEHVRWGQLDEIKKLVDSGLVDIDVQDKHKRTALQVAAKRGHYHIVRYLIKQGATLDTADPSGNTPVMYAAMSARLDIVTLLIEAGANLALENNYGHRANTLAAKGGKPINDKISEKLVSCGAYANLEKDYDSKTYWKRNIVIRQDLDVEDKVLIELLLRLNHVVHQLTGKKLHADTTSTESIIAGLEQAQKTLSASK